LDVYSPRTNDAKSLFRNDLEEEFMLTGFRHWKCGLVILHSLGLLGPTKAWSVEKIRLGVSTRNVVLMPFYYARDKKLFDR
jgi:hypothetical protein